MHGARILDESVRLKMTRIDLLTKGRGTGRKGRRLAGKVHDQPGEVGGTRGTRQCREVGTQRLDDVRRALVRQSSASLARMQFEANYAESCVDQDCDTEQRGWKGKKSSGGESCLLNYTLVFYGLNMSCSLSCSIWRAF